ncbi:MAG: NUDIX hydrolase N-terminal domain-containing protein [Anaerolineae bacterium]|nr:NUDIX hydrolase N-terminal domain-containing protein [Anaerolineae bacterium]
MKSNDISLAQQLALWADELRECSAMGLHFSKNIYDRAHYTKVQDIAMVLMALATDTPLAAMEPLRDTIFSHPTPFAVGDGAVIDGAGRILLIRRADNGLWAMPGGALETGETPAEGVAREVLEETGVQAEAVALVGVFDSRLCGSLTRHHLYHFVFLCRPLNGGVAGEVTYANEVLGSGWFVESDLPQAIDPGHVTRIPHAFRVWRGEGEAFFDR